MVRFIATNMLCKVAVWSWQRGGIRFYSQSKKLDIVFFGTDEFASTHLKALIKDKLTPHSRIGNISLVCPPDKYTGRKRDILVPSPTKGLAAMYGIPVFHTPAEGHTLDHWQLPAGKYDLGVVVSFGFFIPPHIIQLFREGAINVHPSLLPKYRGAAPIQHTILQGDSETGVTIQELDDKAFDAGRILSQTRVDLSDDNAPYYKALRDRLANVGQTLLLETVQNIETYREKSTPQDLSLVTRAPKVQKEWSEINFDEMEAWQIEQLHRAIGEQYPLRTDFTFTRIKRSKKVKQRFISIQLLHLYLPLKSPFYKENWVPGTFLLDPVTEHLHIFCANGTVIAATHIKAENKNVISAKDFANGYEIRQHGQFGYIDEKDVTPEMSGVRVNKRRHEFEKSIRRRLKMRKFDFERVYKS